MKLELFNPWWLALLLLLAIALAAVSYAVRRADRRYERMKVKEALSPEMKEAIEREREENRRKKEQFEGSLREATSPKHPA